MTLPSSRFPWLNIETDGARKARHARLILDVISALHTIGISRINASHVRDGGLDHSLPLCYRGRRYDISYLDDTGELIMVEIMRTYCTENTP